jgi:preprotein translocase subunit SecA
MTRAATPACNTLQANINPEMEPEQWPLDDLARKIGQYCFLLENVTGDHLREACQGDYEKLRAFLHKNGEDAYHEKVRACQMSSPSV